MDKTGWTLILWDIENVPVPRQLQDTDGIKALRKVLHKEFAESRDKQLYCIKFACWWPDYTSKYADLLGNLTLLADMEAVTYHWQGKPDKNHNADEMLMQAADRFAFMMEHTKGPSAEKSQHLIVFITSDQDFASTITRLQNRGFRVEVVYHDLIASHRPVSIINTADASHNWLPFLREHLGMSDLVLGPYDETKQAKQAGTGACDTPREWSKNHEGRPAKTQFAAQTITHRPNQCSSASTAARPMAAAPRFAQGSSVVEFSGWKSVNEWAIMSEYKLLLEACGVATAAIDAAILFTAANLLSATLDFSKLPDGALHAAKAAKLMNKQAWRTFEIKAQHSANAALLPSKPPASAYSNSPGSSGVASSNGSIKHVSSMMQNGHHDSPDESKHLGGNTQLSNADRIADIAPTTAVRSSTNSFGDAGNYSAAGDNQNISWGYDSPQGSQLFSQGQGAQMEEQWNSLQSMADANKANSKLRWFVTLFGKKSCKIDLLQMAMFDGSGNQEGAFQVWRSC